MALSSEACLFYFYLALYSTVLTEADWVPVSYVKQQLVDGTGWIM